MKLTRFSHGFSTAKVYRSTWTLRFNLFQVFFISTYRSGYVSLKNTRNRLTSLALTFLATKTCEKSVLIFLLLLSQFFYSCHKHKNAPSELIVAKINETPITLKQFLESFAEIKNQYDSLSKNNITDTSKLKSIVLNNLIRKELLFQSARQKNILVTDSEVEEHVRILKQDYPGDSFSKMLISKGTTMDQWKKEERTHLLHQKVYQDKTKENATIITSKEVKEYYSQNISQYNEKEKIHLNQIFVKTEALAKSLLLSIKGGGAFESLAKKHSESPDGEAGGSLGYFAKGEKISEFDQAFKWRIGALNIIKSSFGYHVVKVVDKKPAIRLSFSEVEQKITALLKKERDEAFFKEWLSTVLYSSKIYVDEKLLNTIQ